VQASGGEAPIPGPAVALTPSQNTATQSVSEQALRELGMHPLSSRELNAITLATGVIVVGVAAAVMMYGLQRAARGPGAIVPTY
jgi:hypothetical protein